jgi:hypothetical protein
MSYTDSEEERATFMNDKEYKNSSSKRVLSLRSFQLLTICNIVFFVASLSLYASVWLGPSKPNPKLRQFSSYCKYTLRSLSDMPHGEFLILVAPLLDVLDLPLEVKTMNGTLYPSKNASVARLPPSPEVDAVWDEWEITRVYAVTADQIRAMGKDPATATKLEVRLISSILQVHTNFHFQDKDFGLGDDAYATIFDVYHQLHCLNWLRKLIYPDYYPNARDQFPKSVDPKKMFELHMGHCVDLIMQSIQCSGNLNLITMHWVHEERIPFPDMSINRQCVANFDAITDWRMENQVDIEKYIKISTFTSWRFGCGAVLTCG